MKGIYSALIAAVLFGSTGVALANDTPRADDEIPSGPSEEMSTQTGSANTQAGDTAVKGDTAFGDQDEENIAVDTPRADEEIPSGPSEEMSTQTGSANTEPGDTEVQSGVTGE